MRTPRFFRLPALILVSGAVAATACAPTVRLGARSRGLTAPGGAALVLTELDVEPSLPDPPAAVVVVVRGPGDGPIAGQLRAASGFAMLGMRVAFVETARPEDSVPAVRTALDDVLGRAAVTPPVVLVGGLGRGAVAEEVAAADARVTHVVLLGEVPGRQGRAPVLAILDGDAPACLEAQRVDCARHRGLAPGLVEQPLLPRVEVDVVRWFGATGLLRPVDAARYEQRVRRQHPEAFGGSG